ncbi:MAG: hypothetical protein HRU38_20480 [Saccharospirillaceae bacterium]|nr:hypothetical protein [Pseudomonadales bacterium]NRB81010.1 hypothetical protein [Saccharospirillaceae bacterium]
MKKINGNVIPLEPDTQEALEEVLKSGGSAKVMLEGSDTVFLMAKAEKGNDYELTQVTVKLSNEKMRSALEKIKQQIKK